MSSQNKTTPAVEIPPLPKETGKSKAGQFFEAALLFLVCALLVFAFGYHCPFRMITGVDCPGCGMTRALVALLQGNMAASWHYHPFLIPTLILLLAIAASSMAKRKRVSRILLGIWIAGMLGCWIFRLFVL